MNGLASSWGGERLERSSFSAVVIVLVALLAYANSFPGAFILDDVQIVLNNPLVQQLDLAAIWRSDYWHVLANTGLYRPLTTLSLAFNRLLLGNGAWGYHLVNVLLHGGVSVLLWMLLRRWGFSSRMALWSALLFAVHPLHTEVVDVVVGRSELLVAFFLLLASLSACSQQRFAPVLTGLAFLLALLSKEHAITFVVLLPLLDAFFSRSWEIWRLRWRLYALLGMLALIWLVWRQVGVVSALPPAAASPIDTPLAFVSWSGRLVSGIALQWFYLGKLLVPTGLQIFYATSELPKVYPSAATPTAFLLLLSAAGALAAVVYCWRLHLAPALFGALYLVAFTPVANLFLPIGVTFAERLAYFPSIWFCCAIAAAIELVVVRYGIARLAWWGLGLYLLLLGGVSLARNRDFATESRLYAAEVRNNRDDFRGWVNLAESLAVEGDYSGAEAAYQQMLRIDRGFVYGLRSHALFLALTGRREEARLAAEEAVSATRSLPPVEGALQLEALAEAFVMIGQAQRGLELLDRAAEVLRDPNRRLALRGRALSALGRDPEAVATLARLDSAGADAETLHAFGLSLFRLGRLSEARKQLEAAVAAGADAESWNLLGAVCAQEGDWGAAVRALEQAVVLEPENRNYRDNLQQAIGRNASRSN